MVAEPRREAGSAFWVVTEVIDTAAGALLAVVPETIASGHELLAETVAPSPTALSAPLPCPESVAASVPLAPPAPGSGTRGTLGVAGTWKSGTLDDEETEL